MSECTHECSTCGESCSQRQEPQSLLKELNPAARVGKVYGVVSGKGGVGKSMTTCQLAVTMRRRGYQVGVLDADVTVARAFVPSRCGQRLSHAVPAKARFIIVFLYTLY